MVSSRPKNKSKRKRKHARRLRKPNQLNQLSLLDDNKLRVVAPVPLFESQFAYAFVPLPLAIAGDTGDTDVAATEELRGDVLARCSRSSSRSRLHSQRGSVASRTANRTAPTHTIRDLPIKDNPWREGLRVRSLFAKPGGRKRNSLKALERRRAARKKPLVAKDERTFLSMLAFFDATADDIDCFIADNDLETKIINDYVQDRIWNHGTAMVQASWGDTRRQKASTGLTKEEARRKKLIWRFVMMQDPDG